MQTTVPLDIFDAAIKGESYSVTFTTFTGEKNDMIILHVDDDPDDSALFCEAVKEVSPAYTCLVADSAASALEILSDRQRIPDYIFMDMNMPKMNGLECLKLIKNNHALHHIKVIMYSTASDPAYMKEFKKLGAGFLPKPDRYDTLVKSLTELLS